MSSDNDQGAIWFVLALVALPAMVGVGAIAMLASVLMGWLR